MKYKICIYINSSQKVWKLCELNVISLESSCVSLSNDDLINCNRLSERRYGTVNVVRSQTKICAKIQHSNVLLSLVIIVSRTMVTDYTVPGQLALKVEFHGTTIPIHIIVRWTSISRNDSLSDHGLG